MLSVVMTTDPAGSTASYRLEAMVKLDPMPAMMSAITEAMTGPSSSGAGGRGTLAIIAIGDYFFQYRSWFQRQKMSLQEIKEEFKQSEGDPHIKGKLRQLRQQRSKKRMMAAVPKASVIITNPTHYSVALSYERGMSAPICVAKGVDNLAFKIREIAREHDIPIVENVPLARALYATAEIDQEILHRVPRPPQVARSHRLLRHREEAAVACSARQ